MYDQDERKKSRRRVKHGQAQLGFKEMGRGKGDEEAALLERSRCLRNARLTRHPKSGPRISSALFLYAIWGPRRGKMEKGSLGSCLIRITINGGK